MPHFRFTAIHSSNFLIQANLWKLFGFASSTVGLISYALSSSFKHLFGEWNLLKIFAFGMVSLIISSIMLLGKKWKISRSSLLEAHVGFLILMLTSFYSFFCDKSMNGKPDLLGLISNGAFAFMVLSLSRQIELGFEADLFNFFLGCFAIQLMKINLLLAFVAAAFSYSLIVLRSYLNSKIGRIRNDVGHVSIQIDTENDVKGAAEMDNNRIKELYKILRVEEVSQKTVILEENFMNAISAGFMKECCCVYSNWRRQIMEESLLAMELPRLSMEEVQQMPWQDLENQIERWIKASNTFLRISLQNERQLCDRFFGFSSIGNCTLMKACQASVFQLLNFPNVIVAIESHPMESLSRIVRLFETLRDLMPKFESLFSHQYCVILRNEANSTLRRLGEAIRGCFAELEILISLDSAEAVMSEGMVYPIAEYVMNYLIAVCQSWHTLEQVFEQREKLDDLNHSNSSLSAQMTRILQLLKSNLEAKSRMYKDTALCTFSMMNNLLYIVDKVRHSQLRSLLGEVWIQKHAEKSRQHHVNYLRSSWIKVLDLLKLENESLEPNAMKERLKLFEMQFEGLCRVQSDWSALDDQLREEIIFSLEECLVPMYRKFIEKFKQAQELEKHEEKIYIKFGVKDIGAKIAKLLKGSSGSIKIKKL